MMAVALAVSGVHAGADIVHWSGNGQRYELRSEHIPLSEACGSHE